MLYIIHLLFYLFVAKQTCFSSKEQDSNIFIPCPFRKYFSSI